MCGIFAAINTLGHFDTSTINLCIKSTEMIDYRGPDAQGTRLINYHRNDNTVNEPNVFLGHRRLSIIDLTESGSQPMQYDNCILIYNGEIFNYVELRNELKDLGHQFKTESDTEVILHTYAEYGSNGFSRFNGMWAFVLVDLKKKLAICSRDRFSIKPLYYVRQNGNWYFGSEIKQLLPFIISPAINNNIAYQFIQQQLIEHTNETFFDGLLKVPSKSSLILDLNSGEHRIEQYWDYSSEFTFQKEDDLIDSFHSLLDDSVRIRMRSDVSVGALLSGGLDSSAISVLADKYSPGKFETFSVVSDERKFSEEHFVDELIQYNRLNNFKLRFKSDMIPDTIDKVIYHQDQPFGSLSVVAQYLMFQSIAQNNKTKVILSGQGGDEILLGYLKYYFFNLIESRRKHKYHTVLRELIGSLINRTVLWQLEWNEMKRYLPSFASANLDFIKFKGPIADIWNVSSVRQRQQLDIDKYSVPALAHYEDRNSMASSIESRLPFLDHRIVNFLLGIPADLKLKNGWTKYILRKSMNELPNSIRWRRDKKGFITPESVWLKNQLVPLVRNEFKKSGLHEAGFINSNKFLNYYDEFLQGKRNVDSSLIFRIFIFEKWFKMNFKN